MQYTSGVAAPLYSTQSKGMTNTLDFDPEWGAIDLIEEVERAFAIKIADSEAEGCWTVGDIYKVIRAHTPLWDEQDGSCASSAVFYQVRRFLAPEGGKSISPASSLTRAGMCVSQLFKSLRRDTGLRLPAVEMTIVGVFGGWMCLSGMISGLVALFAGAWLISGIGALTTALGLLLLYLDPARLPDGVTTVGDLVRRMVPLNVQKLVTVGARPPNRWSILVALAVEHGILPQGQIRRDTFLLRKGMKLASARK